MLALEYYYSLNQLVKQKTGEMQRLPLLCPQLPVLAGISADFRGNRCSQAGEMQRGHRF
jgi:hypothetical protein